MSHEPSPLDDLIGRFSAANLLGHPSADGRGVRVALIDSGIDREVLATKHPTARIGDTVLVRGEGVAPTGERTRPSAPHGTTVADILLTRAPGIELFSADVFGPGGTTEVETVIRALRHAIDVWKCSVVNLSLGVPESKLQPPVKRMLLQKAIEEAYFRDVLVFAAAHNDHPVTKSFPAAFAPPLISVDKAVFDRDPQQFAYQLREMVEFAAHGRGYLGPFAREPATSWAVPHLAAVAARILSLRPGMKLFELKTVLYWISRNSY